MRIVAAVVAGAVLLASGHAAHGAEARRQRSEKCLEICNFTFEQCQKDTSPKANERCNIDIVRCKNACPFVTIEEPAVPTAVSHQRCIDRCRDAYQKCLRRPENKGGGKCAADDVRCEQACPKPPEPAVAGAPGAPAAGGAAAGAAPAAVAPKKVKRGPRIEGPAAPAPISPTPVAVPNERPAPAAERPAGSVPAYGEAVPPAAVAPAAAVPASAAPAVAAPAAPAAAAPAAAAHPQPAERGFWGTLGCFFVQCEQPGTTPCLQQCGDAYDQCRVRESKRGGECNTRLMNCRKDCSAAAR
ncbi:MAG: hypothetical protein IT293_18770 [Deltaproteobacteria bacterium]|nr:hypothetical protein [Deltaproteobacteria bacterium]